MRLLLVVFCRRGWRTTSPGRGPGCWPGVCTGASDTAPWVNACRGRTGGVL